MAQPVAHKKEQVIFMLSPSDKRRLQVVAESRQTTTSELVREWVRTELDRA